VWAETVKNNTVFLGTISRGQNAEKTRLQTELARAERILAEIDAARQPQALATGTAD
jgi:hypothetical protein